MPFGPDDRDGPDDLDGLVASLPLPAVIVDLHRDRIAAINPAAAMLLDHPPATLAFSRLVRDAMPQMVVFADEIAHRGAGWSRSIPLTTLAGRVIALELHGRFLDGRARLLMLSLLSLAALSLRERQSEIAQIQGGGLVEWQRAQRFFTELERQNHLILDAAGEGIYGLNADGQTTFVNRAAQEMLGWTTEDLLGRDIHSMIHHHHLNGEVYPAQHCPIYQSFHFEKVHRIEDEVFWRKDGRPIRVEYVSTPIYDGTVLAGAVVIFRDITERKENERRLRDAMAEVAALRDRLELENAYLQEEITQARAHHDILGASQPVRQILSRIALVSKTSAAVLITGEPGTGKSLVASAIHKDSGRARRPLVHFKCGSVPAEAMEAELFGQVRGAYPGALRDRPGRLELAHGGTLFLDEVTEIPLSLQGHLLQSLQAGQVTRLGDRRPRDADLRLIAASSRDLEREVAAGRFRQDLYFHLSVFPIHCPPLRDRVEDIPVLAQDLLVRVAGRLNRRVPVITSGTMQRLQAYAWPGNVRELSNVIERGAIVSTGDKFVLDLAEGQGKAAAVGVMSQAEIDALILVNLRAVLRQAQGRVSGPGGAAEILGLPATTVYSRLRAAGIRSGPD